MKHLFLFTLISLFTFTSISQAQTWKELKNKAKNKASKVVKEKAESDDKSSGTSTSTSSSTKSPVSTLDEEYNNFVAEKYALIQSYEANLNTSNLERGNINPEKHLASAKKLDYPATLKKLQEKQKKGLTKNEAYHYDIVLGYGKKYQTVFDNVIKGTINRYIEDGYLKKKNSPKEAVEQIKRAQNIAQAALYINPKNETAKRLKADADNALQDIGGDYDKLFTSDFHKENAGKILFSKQPIIPGEEDPNQFTTDFTVRDNIYAMAYKDQKITGGGSKYLLQIDGGNYEHIMFKHNEEDEGKTVYPIEIIPKVDKAIHGIDAKQFARVFSRLSPRNHSIKIEFEGTVGTFNINLAGMDAEKLKANAETATKNAQDNYAKNRRLPKEYKQQSQKFSDQELSHANMKSILKKKWLNCDHIMKLIVLGDGTADDWLIYKNEVDIPTYKLTYPGIIALYKGKDGWCYTVKKIGFKRDYLGGGKYSKVKLSHGGVHTKIDCKNCQ